eukprot:gene327-418_t
MASHSKKYYTIGEVAMQFGVSTSLIRYWEKRFKQLAPQKSNQGIRQYTQDDIAKFKRVYELVKTKGYTIQGAQETLKSNSTYDPVTLKEMVSTLNGLKVFLQELQQELYIHSLTCTTTHYKHKNPMIVYQV